MPAERRLAGQHLLAITRWYAHICWHLNIYNATGSKRKVKGRQEMQTNVQKCTQERIPITNQFQRNRPAGLMFSGQRSGGAVTTVWIISTGYPLIRELFTWKTLLVYLEVQWLVESVQQTKRPDWTTIKAKPAGEFADALPCSAPGKPGKFLSSKLFRFEFYALSLTQSLGHFE